MGRERGEILKEMTIVATFEEEEGREKVCNREMIDSESEVRE